jgi:putative oxidoreductase
MKTKILNITDNPVQLDIILLLIRLVTGFAFMHHGWGKIQHPMNWMGEGALFPGIFQALAAIAEFIGGAALVLGFLSRISAFGIFCDMIVALYVHLIIRGDLFVNVKGGSSYELALLFLVIAILFLIMGPGRFSLDRIIFGKD